MGWVADATPRLLYPPERPCTHYIGGWVGPRAGLYVCGKSRHQPDSIPGPSSESLYRLSYPGHLERLSTRRKSRLNATLSTTNPTRTSKGSNMGLRSDRPVNSRLGHATALEVFRVSFLVCSWSLSRAATVRWPSPPDKQTHIVHNRHAVSVRSTDKGTST
jgi:hypothetical protein